MKNLVNAFGSQLAEALVIATKTNLPADWKPSNILVTGLGGSGIGGTILSDLVSSTLPVPLIINKEYHIPGFAGPGTLVIVSSYSGNTEETLSAMKAAMQCGSKIICISSGGEVARLAVENNFPLFLIPGGMPPRACLGYSLIQLLAVFEGLGWYPGNLKEEVNGFLNELPGCKEELEFKANQIAAGLFGKTAVLYAMSGYEGVAIRFRQQINENGKELCWHHVIPEMNHNELVGWTRERKDLKVIFIYGGDDFERNLTRAEINKTVISKFTEGFMDIEGKGKTKLTRTLYLIHLFDLVSVHLAALKNIDPVEVKVIDFLKGRLAQS